MDTKDTIYKNRMEIISPFEFNEEVAGVFDDMAERSIPFYSQVQEAISGIIKLKYNSQGVIYDLGCSTGNTIYHILKKLQSPEARITGVDSSEAMCRKCRNNLQKYNLPGHVKVMQKDVREFKPQGSEIVILNYLLQFIPPDNKSRLLKNICNSLPGGGTLILSEKIRQPGSFSQKIYTEIHNRYKFDRGYSELEISQKREALENILTPLTEIELAAMLKEAGFSRTHVFFQWFNFISLIAEK